MLIRLISSQNGCLQDQTDHKPLIALSLAKNDWIVGSAVLSYKFPPTKAIFERISLCTSLSLIFL